MQRREQCFHGRARNLVLRSVGVSPAERHARRLCERGNEFRRRFGLYSMALCCGLLAQDDDGARRDDNAVWCRSSRSGGEAKRPIETVARRRRRDAQGVTPSVQDDDHTIGVARVFRWRIKTRDQRCRMIITPIFVAHRRAIGAAPFDVRNQRIVERSPQQKAVAR